MARDMFGDYEPVFKLGSQKLDTCRSRSSLTSRFSARSHHSMRAPSASDHRLMAFVVTPPPPPPPPHRAAAAPPGREADTVADPNAAPVEAPKNRRRSALFRQPPASAGGVEAADGGTIGAGGGLPEAPRGPPRPPRGTSRGNINGRTRPEMSVPSIRHRPFPAAGLRGCKHRCPIGRWQGQGFEGRLVVPLLASPLSSAGNSGCSRRHCSTACPYRSS